MFKTFSNVIFSTSVLVLLSGGIYFSYKLRFPQLKWKKLFKGLKIKSKTEISPINSLMISLAARIGVGSLAGIALAIYIGGPGTIFWIWITSIITSINTYAECYLGLKYQQKENNEYKGGPSYYLEKGLHNKKLAYIYAVSIILAYILGFMTIQGNTITKSIENMYNINPIIISIVLCFITFISIKRGLRGIVSISNKIVPIMGLFYIVLCLVIVLKNIEIIPIVFKNIIYNAFNFKSLSSGFIISFLIGMQRGVFSTESGLGTTSIACAATTSKNKKDLALMQILGVYFTVFIICTGTALIILTSNYNGIIINNINGIELTLISFKYHLGNYGSNILLIIIIFLAYSTIIAGYYYGESSLKYLIKNIKKIHLRILKLLTLIILFLGSIISASIIWKTVDILVELLAIINMYALIKLRKEIIFDYKNSK